MQLFEDLAKACSHLAVLRSFENREKRGCKTVHAQLQLSAQTASFLQKVGNPIYQEDYVLFMLITGLD